MADTDPTSPIPLPEPAPSEAVPPAPAPEAPAVASTDGQADIQRALAEQKAELEAQFQESQRQAQAEQQALLETKTAEADKYRTLYEQNAIKAAVLSACGQALNPDMVHTLLCGKASVAGDGSVLIDGKPPQQAVDALLNQHPNLARPSGVPGSGAPQSSGLGYSSGNPWSREHFNLTQQTRIARENPAEAARLKAAAGA